MARDMYDDADHYTIEYDDELDAVIHTWTEFSSGQQYRTGANAILEAVEDHDATKLIVDTSNVQAHQDEDKRWLREEWIPRMIETGVTHTVTVHADSVIAEMEMEEISEDAGDVEGTDQFVTADMDEAREWIVEA